jgi:drug/metabolite transporter (DMT)-like permease
MANTNRLSGLAFALAGFALLSGGDAVIKSMAGAWPGTAVAALRYVFGAIGLGAALYWREGKAGFALPLPFIQFGRAVAVSIASVCFFLGIYVMPLAEATVIQFTNPVITALLSAMFLGERAPRAAWVATTMAFAGVVVIVRPNVAHLGLSALLPLAAAFAMACLMIFNRKAAGAASALSMQFLISVVAAPLLIGMALAGHFSGISAFAVTVPSWSVVARCALVSVSASVAHMLIYLATTRASAAVVAPMMYVQLLTATLLGALFFGNQPDLIALLGATLIIGGGLYLWWDQRRAMTG